MNYRDLRDAFGVTQAELASLAGVTQPAVSAYEAGRREPAGRTRRLYRAIEDSLEIPTFQWDTPRRSYHLPADRWTSGIPLGEPIVFPFRLHWSGPQVDPVRQMANPEVRKAVYARVLDEGTITDVCVFIDPDELSTLWPDIPVRRLLRPAVEALTERLAA